MTRSRKAKWLALLTVAGLAGGQAAIGGTFGAFASQTASSGNTITAATDFRGPAVSRIAIGKTSGGGVGGLTPGATYRVYANVTDVGTPPSGTASVTANVSNVTAGQTAVPLTAGSYSAGGYTWNYRSAILTAGAGLNGAYGFTVSATDNATNSTNTNGTVTVDNIVPVPTDISATGGTQSLVENGDVLTFTTNQTLDPLTILANWTGSATTVQVRLRNNGSGDRLEIEDAGGTTLPFGTISLGRTDYVGGPGARFTTSTMTQSGNQITIVLGGLTGSPSTAGGTGTMVWTPTTTISDLAGTAMTATAFNEPAPLDRDF